MKLIPVRELPQDFPFKVGTLYQWHHHNKHPGLLVKYSGKLCVDMDRINEIIVVPENKKAA